MYSIFDVANWFLSQEVMDHKKVQKLCYYAQAWNLVLRNKRLINCDFEAWAHGPVCRELWEKLHEYTYFDIPQDIFSERAKPITNPDDIETLERVWETYKEFNGYQLECLTHRETPWLAARAGVPDLQRCTNKISEEEMKAYYSRLYSGDGIGE